LAQRKDVSEPGSDIALWNPPLLWNVTVSPTAMVSAFGENVMLEFAVTTWFAAEAAVAESSRPGKTAAHVLRAGPRTRIPSAGHPLPPARDIAFATALDFVRMAHLVVPPSARIGDASKALNANRALAQPVRRRITSTRTGSIGYWFNLGFSVGATEDRVAALGRMRGGTATLASSNWDSRSLRCAKGREEPRAIRSPHRRYRVAAHRWRIR
jgi:hypothetical protein